MFIFLYSYLYRDCPHIGRESATRNPGIDHVGPESVTRKPGVEYVVPESVTRIPDVEGVCLESVIMILGLLNHFGQKEVRSKNVQNKMGN